MAEAEAARIRATGEAEADRTARTGVAQAIAIEEQVRAYGGPQYQLTRQVMERFAEAVQQSGVDLVPKIMISGQNGDGQPNVMQALLTMLLSERFAQAPAGVAAASGKPAQPQAEELRRHIRETLAARPPA